MPRATSGYLLRRAAVSLATRLRRRRPAGLGDSSSPVAASSARARAANAVMPIAVSMPLAMCSCSRASTRRFSRRSHSPYRRCARARSGRCLVRPSRRIASRYQPSAASSLLSRARARLDAQPEIGSGGLSRGRQPVQRVRRQRGLPRTDRGFDQLGPRPVGKRPVVVPGSLLGRRQRVGVTARPLCKIAVAQCA
jgi:hypothetical protein